MEKTIERLVVVDPTCHSRVVVFVDKKSRVVLIFFVVDEWHLVGVGEGLEAGDIGIAGLEGDAADF